MLLPLSFDLKGKSILLIGGGKAALEKFNQLSRTPCSLKIVSLAFSPDFMRALGAVHNARIQTETRAFTPEDLEGVFLVFSAVSDKVAAERIFHLCREKNILINSADDRERCDFYTNAVIERGSVQLSVSTQGRFAGLSAVLRRHLEDILPRELDAEWEKIFALRERALALQDVSEKKSVITDIVKLVEERYFARKNGEKNEQ